MKVFDISLKMMRLVTDVMNGTATDGAVTSLTDTVNLVQGNEYYDKGTVWIKSGTHAGKALRINGFSSNRITFAELETAIVEGVRYTVARGSYPWEQIVGAIQTALDDTYVIGHNASLTGDGQTHVFTLPTGVSNVQEVRFTRADREEYNPISNHWDEGDGDLVFDEGFAPKADDVIDIAYKKYHVELTGYDTEISTQINPEWLVLRSAMHLLVWGAQQYEKRSEFMIENRLNLVREQLRGKRARLGGLNVRMKSAGGGNEYSSLS